VSEADRYSKGLAERTPLYGNKIKGNLADLPGPFNEAMPRFCTLPLDRIAPRSRRHARSSTSDH
jgi:hypothetical protein